MRELQAQAIEKRLKENETRGIKDIESVKRAQARKEAQENLANANTPSQGGLRVSSTLTSLLVNKQTSC